jgi:4-hydroxy-tetrahydrodipicolinate synthase
VTSDGDPEPASRIPGFLRGVLPVLLTPFDEDGGVDFSGIATVARHVLSTGVPSVMYPGYASEFYRLSDRERAELTSTVVQVAAAHGAQVIQSVTEQATVLAVESARRAVEVGCGAVNVLAPTTLGGDSGQVRAHLSAVLQACAPLPAVIQHAPALTGSALALGDLRRLAQECPNLVGVKVETLPAGPTVTALQTIAPELGCLVGYGGLHLIDALERGASGVQPGSSFVEIYQHIWAAWAAGDRSAAAELHAALVPFLAYWMQDVRILVQVEKLIARRRGWIASDHCRAPDRPLDKHETRLVDRFLSQFEHIVTP